MMNLLKNIFSITKDDRYCIVKILGIKFSKKNKNYIKLQNTVNKTINKELCLQNLYYTHEKVFPQFKNINDGKDVVIIATGPTLAKYVNPIKDAINIGLNRAYQFDKVKLDYIFMQDGNAVKSYIEDIDKLENVEKFYGRRLFNENYREGIRLPEYHLKSKNAHEFYSYNYSDCDIKPNIAVFPLFSAASVSFPAIHFALYTHPKRIYLVGCDSNSAPYWDGGKREDDYLVQANKVNNMMLDGYKKLKEFQETYYPDVEIISINPVGLKGIFKDIYTEEAVQ